MLSKRYCSTTTHVEFSNSLSPSPEISQQKTLDEKKDLDHHSDIASQRYQQYL